MIGLFLGEKKLPLEILKSLKKKKIKYFIIDLSKNNKFKKDRNSYFINIGKFGKILELIKSKKCKKVLFAGKIAKPNFSSLRLDFKGIYYMPSVIRAAKIGDAAIIKSIIKILNNEEPKNVKVSSHTIRFWEKQFKQIKQYIFAGKNNFITVKTGHDLKPKVIMSHGIGKLRFQPKLKQRLFCL